LRLGAFASIFPFLEIRILFFSAQRRRACLSAGRTQRNSGAIGLTFRRGGQVSRVSRPACRRQDPKDLMRFGKDEKKSQPLKVRIQKKQLFCATKKFLLQWF
jgi:hypothetical protein